METWAGYTIRAYADPKYNMLKHCNMESALCVINHRGDLEWMAGFCLIDRIGMLGVCVACAVVGPLYKGALLQIMTSLGGILEQIHLCTHGMDSETHFLLQRKLLS